MLEYLSDKTVVKVLCWVQINWSNWNWFWKKWIKPIEFGGDMGTTAITETLSGLLKDNEIQKQILT